MWLGSLRTIFYQTICSRARQVFHLQFYSEKLWQRGILPMVGLFSVLWVRSSSVHFLPSHFPKYLLSRRAWIRRQWRCEIHWIMLCHVTVGFLRDRRSLKSFKGHAGPKEVNGKSPLDSNRAKKQLSNFFCQVGVFHITHDWWQRNSALARSLAPCLY